MSRVPLSSFASLVPMMPFASTCWLNVGEGSATERPLLVLKAHQDLNDENTQMS